MINRRAMFCFSQLLSLATAVPLWPMGGKRLNSDTMVSFWYELSSHNKIKIIKTNFSMFTQLWLVPLHFLHIKLGCLLFDCNLYLSEIQNLCNFSKAWIYFRLGKMYYRYFDIYFTVQGFQINLYLGECSIFLPLSSLINLKYTCN